MNFAKVVESSGLAKVELAVLYATSRQTIHTWAAGGAPRPDSLFARQAASITAALLALIERKALPLGAMDKDARRARIEKMAEKLAALKPAPR